METAYARRLFRWSYTGDRNVGRAEDSRIRMCVQQGGAEDAWRSEEADDRLRMVGGQPAGWIIGAPVIRRVRGDDRGAGP